MTLQEKHELRPARKVLVIDDEEAFCVMMARMISNLGYKAMTSNRAKSVHLDEMTESDIIFVDIMMPEMGGTQVLEELSRLGIKSSIVLMSGADIEVLTTAESLAKLLNLQLIGILDKPFRERDIRAILEAD